MRRAVVYTVAPTLVNVLLEAGPSAARPATAITATNATIRQYSTRP